MSSVFYAKLQKNRSHPTKYATYFYAIANVYGFSLQSYHIGNG